jgi:hypothetical protein
MLNRKASDVREDLDLDGGDSRGGTAPNGGGAFIAWCSGMS